MKSVRTARFKQLYEHLPISIQQQADEAYALWEKDPFHPSLHFKVIDEKGKLIAKGRDLPELKARCRVETHRPVKQQKGEFKTFPENFTFEASQKVTGVVVKQYQALVPTKTFAEIEETLIAG